MSADDKIWVPTHPTLKSRYQVKSPSSRDRWIRDPELGWPTPTMFRGRPYNKMADIEEFDRRREALSRAQAEAKRLEADEQEKLVAAE